MLDPEAKTSVSAYDRLTQIMSENPDLIFNNGGYEYLSKEVIAANKDAITEIEKIMRQCVKDFVYFNNFKPRKDGSYAVRCQIYYNDDRSFIGVAYISLDKFVNEQVTL